MQLIYKYLSNNYIGADNTSQTLIDFDWYYPHLYYVPEELQKTLNIPVFLHHINVRKRVYIIPPLCELKIENSGKTNLHVYFLRLNDTEKSPPHTKKMYTKASVSFSFRLL